MPSPIRDALPDLIAAELKTRPPKDAQRAPERSPVSTLSPTTASLVGGLMDSGSTYAFLKRKTGHEDNALIAGLAKKSPELLTALGVAANLALPLVWKQIAKKFPGVGNALAANQGALQMGYGALNTQHTLSPRVTAASEAMNSATLYRTALLEQMRRGSK
jgi:hypothetical protein